MYFKPGKWAALMAEPVDVYIKHILFSQFTRSKGGGLGI